MTLNALVEDVCLSGSSIIIEIPDDIIPANLPKPRDGILKLHFCMEFRKEEIPKDYLWILDFPISDIYSIGYKLIISLKGGNNG